MWMVLEGNGKIGAILTSRKVEFHARVDIATVVPVLLHLVSDEFEGLTHAILGHLLFSFAQFLELYQQC